MGSSPTEDQDGRGRWHLVFKHPSATYSDNRMPIFNVQYLHTGRYLPSTRSASIFSLQLNSKLTWLSSSICSDAFPPSILFNSGPVHEAMLTSCAAYQSFNGLNVISSIRYPQSNPSNWASCIHASKPWRKCSRVEAINCRITSGSENTWRSFSGSLLFRSFFIE